MNCRRCGYENPADSSFCIKCGADLLPAENPLSSTKTFYVPKLDLSVGTIFARRYQVIEELGRGGMGTVYKVLDREINEKIAIKVLKPEISFDEKTIERFRNELKLARKISHQNVCRMYDIVKEQGLYFITMEYITGEDLKSTILRLGQVSVGKTLRITRQICRGLAEAHRLGVVHRDLKPHNIIIDREGEVRIMDFGIALSARTAGITEAGVMIGTPEYMSPEQASGKDVDNRSDIYSLGIIMFELLTGRVPFEGDSPVDVALMHSTQSPPDPRSINPQIPKEISALVLKCLERDRNKRFSNCEEIVSEISRIEKGHPTTERLLPDPKKQWSASIPQSRLSKLIVPVATVSTIVLLIGVYFLFLRPKKSPPDNDIVKPPENGVFAVTSVPPGATVYVDDEPQGIAPFSLDLPPGRYKIRVSYPPDWDDYFDDLEIEAGEKIPREYSLKPLYLIEILSDPKEAAVRIDGELQGKTPVTVKLNKSSCLLELEKGKGWKPSKETLNLKQGRNPPKTVNLTPLQAKFRLRIKSDPAGALVYVDGERWGISPQEKTISPGTHEVRLEKEGYKPETISLPLSSDFTQTYTLAKIEKATIILSAVPSAEVYIDGARMFIIPPKTPQAVEEGKHIIEFVSLSDKNKKYSVELTIKAGETKTVHMNLDTGKHRIT